METDDLIERLVASHRPVSHVRIERGVAVVVVLGVASALVAVSATIGFRGDLIAALVSGRIVPKYAFLLTMAAMSGYVFVVLARPGRRLARQIWLYVLPIGFIVCAMLIQLQFAGLPNSSTIIGDDRNWIDCMAIVPVLGALPFVGLIRVLRQAAPTDLPGAGFAAGVFSAAIAAIVYAAHCPCDTPVFVAIWYPLAFCISGLAGRQIAPRVARW